jgi:hypothetical protein
MNSSFNTENIDSLKSICERIISLCDESVDGDLMISQKLFLGDAIVDFRENPIIENSGLINK